jgi:hypothetical protein
MFCQQTKQLSRCPDKTVATVLVEGDKRSGPTEIILIDTSFICSNVITNKTTVMSKRKRNAFIQKNLGSFIKTNPFFGVRLGPNLLIIKPEEYEICFFVDNHGDQVVNPENGKLQYSGIETWVKKVENKKQFRSSRNLDKIFLENIFNLIWVIPEKTKKTP